MILFLASPLDRLWKDKDPFLTVEELEGKVFRALEGRRTLRTEIEGRGYFVKIHRGIGWREIFKNLSSLRFPVLGARNEWNAIQKLQELGVPTMKVIAYGCRGRNPASQHSFIVTEELSDTINLANLTVDWTRTPPPTKLKHALINEVARMARTMHQGGVNHRDFYLCHFRLQNAFPLEPERLKLSLIDLHRAQIRARVPRRWRDKDLAGLFFSVLNIGLTQRDLLRFLQIYFARPLRDVLKDEAALLRYLKREAERLADRYQRKNALPEQGGQS